MRISGIETLLRNQIDTPDWEKDLDNPAAAISHQLLVSIAAVTGLREVIWNRVDELLEKHDNIADFVDEMNAVHEEFVNDLQLVLHGTSLGDECKEQEAEFSVVLEHLRKGNAQ
jgi:hypothetical protein